jgi:hypothetical protein
MKAFTIDAPAGIAGQQSTHIGVGVYGWTEGATDPARITVCDIPDTPAARQWVRRALLHEQPELNLSNPSANASDVARRVAARVATARPRAATADVSINMIVDDCDPTYMECTCDPMAITCGDYTPAPEDPGPQPPPPPLVDDLVPVSPDPSYGYVPGPSTITCRSKTQYVHISGADVSVHGQTSCDYPIQKITLRVALSKQRCLSFFFFSYCWMSEKDSVQKDAPSSYTYFELPLHVPCTPGWWEGKTTHWLTAPAGYYPPVTELTTYSPYDLIVYRC